MIVSKKKKEELELERDHFASGYKLYRTWSNAYKEAIYNLYEKGVITNDVVKMFFQEAQKYHDEHEEEEP